MGDCVDFVEHGKGLDLFNCDRNLLEGFEPKSRLLESSQVTKISCAIQSDP